MQVKYLRVEENGFKVRKVKREFLYPDEETFKQM